MNLGEIKSLAEIVTAYGLTCLEVSENGVMVRLEKGTPPPSSSHKGDAILAVPPQDMSSADIGVEAVNFNRLIEVKSPLVGVFYSAPSPDAETFVSIGDKVKKGDVLCIIEAMKTMNEIQAEQDGEIVDICVKNGDIAEYGQVLFKMF